MEQLEEDEQSAVGLEEEPVSGKVQLHVSE